MILLVTYDLKTSGKNYTPLYDALKAQGKWWHYLASTWLLDTERSPKDVYDVLAPHIATKDSLMVIQVVAPYWGYLPKKAWEWIQKRI